MPWPAVFNRLNPPKKHLILASSNPTLSDSLPFTNYQKEFLADTMLAINNYWENPSKPKTERLLFSTHRQPLQLKHVAVVRWTGLPIITRRLYLVCWTTSRLHFSGDLTSSGWITTGRDGWNALLWDMTKCSGGLKKRAAGSLRGRLPDIK